MSKRRRFEEEDEDPYVPTDSEDEYSDSEKILLQKARQGKKADIEESEEEVFGLDAGNSSEDEDFGKISDSDIEGKGDEDDYLPDVKAWGKKKSAYYRTDYVDQDYGGYDEQDLEAAENEEEEARAIQNRLIAQLDDADFSLDMFNKKPVQKEEEVKEIIKYDLGKLSKRQKLALMEKESPEFFGLVEDFKKNMTELQEKLEPVLKLIKEGKIPASSADSYVRTKYHLVLNYCINITFYLLLKAKRIGVQSHPVVKRLYQYRQLLKQLEPVDEIMMPQIQVILEKMVNGAYVSASANGTSHKAKKSKKKMLKLLANFKEDTDNLPDAEEIKVEENSEMKLNITDEETNAPIDENDDVVEENEEVLNKEGEEGKRAITYQIAKNKGLTPHRKKENRNPRVKHRNKYRKAQIRRKGQVRQPRNEIKKYGGEISGIKIGVIKSIKLK